MLMLFNRSCQEIQLVCLFRESNNDDRLMSLEIAEAVFRHVLRLSYHDFFLKKLTIHLQITII